MFYPEGFDLTGKGEGSYSFGQSVYSGLFNENSDEDLRQGRYRDRPRYYIIEEELAIDNVRVEHERIERRIVKDRADKSTKIEYKRALAAGELGSPKYSNSDVYSKQAD